MDEWFNTASDSLVFVLGFILLVGAAEAGVALASWHKRTLSEGADRFLATLAGPLLGLLALMIGFTFAMALTRYLRRAWLR